VVSSEGVEDQALVGFEDVGCFFGLAGRELHAQLL